MQYLSNTTAEQNFVVPASGLASGASVTLTIRSTVGHLNVLTANVTITGNTNNYYRMTVSLPSGLSDGEYEYSITQGSVHIGDGIVVIGSLSRAGNPGTATIQFKQL